jgi:hypothetical protein
MTGLEYSEENFQQCLESLGFTEEKNLSFGGYICYDDKRNPLWTYDEEQREWLYMFLSGANYWKLHTM